MRLSQLVGHRFKETPRDAATKSHEYLLRGGYGRQVSAGIYSLLPLGRRITRKIEGIIREEMNRISGQEVKMPVVLPAELWEESGRYETVGPELLRFKDRNQKEMLLGMTHEEAVVHMVRSDVKSHKQLPVMLYQIQTKYRDEARPRAGLIRVREFTMKDGYSFHTSFEDLAEYYVQCHEAYERIFDRIGMKEVVSIRSDTGMMGGKEAHEFMAITEVGEDTIFISDDGVKDDTFIKVAGKYAEGVYASGPMDTSTNPLAKEAVAAHKKEFQEEPGAFFLNAYSAALAMLNAIDKANSTKYEDIVNVLRNEYVATPLGIIKFDERGDAIGVGFSMYQVINGKYIENKK